MRNRLKYGVPAAAGLGAAGVVAAQGGDPMEVIGAGTAGTLGGAAGLLAARQLAGKYNPNMIMQLQKGVSGAGDAIGDYARNLPDNSRVRKGLADTAADVVSAVDNRVFGVPGQTNAAIPFPTQNVQRNVGKAAAAGLVPVAAGSAALGGMAAGSAVGAVGQALGIDPEAPGSSNTLGSRLNMQSPMYM